MNINSKANQSQDSAESHLLKLESDDEDLIDYVAEHSSFFHNCQLQQQHIINSNQQRNEEVKINTNLENQIQVVEYEDDLSQISLTAIQQAMQTQNKEQMKEDLPNHTDQQYQNIDQIKEAKQEENKDESTKHSKSRYSNTYQQPALHYVAHKAGMNSIDKDKIQKMIIEASKDSDYYKREVERTETAKQRAKELKKKIEQYKKNESLWNKKQIELNHLLKEIEQERVLDRTWVYIDMDMFYAAVEIRDNPALADKPVAVGGQSMISTANYVARQYGVRSAMPGFIAKKICPELVFVDLNMSKYKEVSKNFKNVVEEYDSQYESMGLDEASSDVTDFLKEKNLSTPDQKQELAHSMRMRINELTQLTCSAGIACNKMLAKICSDFNKPNGQTYLEADRQKIIEFMSKLSVRKIPGIGRMTELTLASLNIYTCKDIMDKAIEILIAFNERTSRWLFKSALGIARYEHDEDDDDGIQKSISVSSTFRTIHKYEQFKEKLSELSQDLAYRMDKRKVAGMTLTVEFKNTKFQVLQKFSTQVLDQNWPMEPLRLMGVKLSNLKSQHEVKKDKRLNEFFKTGLTKEQQQEQNKKQISLLQKQIKPQQQQTLKTRKSSHSKISTTSSVKDFNQQSSDLGKQQRISSFIVATKLSDSKLSKPNKSSLESSVDLDNSQLKLNIKSQTEVNTKKRPLVKDTSPVSTKKAKKGKKEKKVKKISNQSKTIESFFQSK